MQLLILYLRYLHVTITESESVFCVPIIGRVNTISYARDCWLVAIYLAQILS